MVSCLQSLAVMMSFRSLTHDSWGIVLNQWHDTYTGKMIAVLEVNGALWMLSGWMGGVEEGLVSSLVGQMVRLLSLLWFYLSACIYSHSVLGCVRFWDTCRSGEDMENGEVLARPNVDIGHFSVGDPHKGEKPLVV